MNPKQILQLEAAASTGVIHFLSDLVKVESGQQRTTVTVTRTGKFFDPRYGEFELTEAMFQSIIKNFNEGTFGQDINIDIAHKPENGAGAVVKRLFTDRGRLRAEVEWYELGVSAVQKQGFKYLSAEIHPNFKSNEADDGGSFQEFGPTLLGAGLVTVLALRIWTRLNCPKPVCTTAQPCYPASYPTNYQRNDPLCGKRSLPNLKAS